MSDGRRNCDANDAAISPSATRWTLHKKSQLFYIDGILKSSIKVDPVKAFLKWLGFEKDRMVFCFDVDGTITANPSVFRAIMASLMAVGHKVYPLTGSLERGSVTHQDLLRYRTHQLGMLGIVKGKHYTEISIAIGNTFEDVAQIKGQFCKEVGSSLMVEDVDLFINGIKQHSPDTLCLRMPIV